MKRRTLTFLLVIIVTVSILTVVAEVTLAGDCRVLTVMSYEKDNPWCFEIKKGIQEVFSGTCDIDFYYMNTKRDLAGGPQRAAQAFALYQRIDPDGVIVADDPAQSMFVVPYLKDKVKTPVMFCGVNDDPQKYGYPASNVSGILERNFIGPSIAFAKQLVPTIQTIGFLSRDSPSGRAIFDQVQAEADTYLARYIDFKLVKTVPETLAALQKFRATCDILFVAATNGILDAQGRPLNYKQNIDIIKQAYPKPIIGANRLHVEHGALSAVVKSPYSQGKIAAEMLSEAIHGRPVSELSIRANRYGRRTLNVTVMQELGIKPKRRALIGTELIRN